MWIVGQLPEQFCCRHFSSENRISYMYSETILKHTGYGAVIVQWTLFDLLVRRFQHQLLILDAMAFPTFDPVGRPKA